MIALAIVGIGNMGFHVVISRMLGPDAYGAFGSLLALVTLMTVPATGFQTLVTARTARVVDAGHPADGRVLYRRALTLGATAAVGLLVLSPLIQHVLKLGSWWPTFWLSLYALPLSAIVVPWGLLCGQRRFGLVGAISVISPVGRIGVGIVSIRLGFGVSGTVAASVIADSLQALGLYLAVRSIKPAHREADPVVLRLRGGSSIGGVTAYVGLWLLVGIDTIAARILFDETSAGRYSAAATALHSALYAAQTISLLALPAFASTDLARSMRALRWALLGTGLLTVPAMGLLTVLSPRLIPAVFGPTFQVPIGVIALMAVGTTIISMLWAFVQYNIAQSRRAAGAAWLGLPVAAAGAAIWHRHLWVLAAIMIVATAVPLAVAVRSLRSWNRSAARRADAPPVLAEPAVPVDLTVVVPFYNPGAALRANLLRLIEVLRGCGVTFEIIAVDDGSGDGSAATIADLDPTVVTCLIQPHNQGKGAALRRGLSEGNGRYLGFIDADGDLDPALWGPFIQLARLYQPDAIIGDKLHPLTQIDRAASWTRNLYSWGFRTLVRTLFPHLRVRDTQVGLKVFRREVLADVLPRTRENRFVLDIEMLALAQRLGYRRILTAPVSLYRVDRTTVHAGTALRMLVDTLRVAWRVQVVDSYRLDPLAARPPAEPEPLVVVSPRPRSDAVLDQPSLSKVS